VKWLTGRRLPRWTGVAVPVVALPWVLSSLSVRHGWVAERPGLLNLIGLIPVTAGFLIYFLCMREHFLAAPDGWLLEKTANYPTPTYLLTAGPYRYSCNPVYLAELVIWLGWLVFYGSFVLAGTFATLALLIGPIIVPREERGLEARFGDAYREFRRKTPRWLGKPGP
jgi:protein-S-isoprenylcysteine O-methyltransferase Ste14